MKKPVFMLFVLASAVFFAWSSAGAQSKAPRTVRDFFNLLPQKYFTLEGCVDNPTKANCDRARRAYVADFLEVEDTANGYLKSGCDGAQRCLTMALFKRANGTYLVALAVEFEGGIDNYFLDYKNGRWTDVGAREVPQFSRRSVYELPQRGTTVGVFAASNSPENGPKGKKLYDLVWKNGKFSVKR